MKALMRFHPLILLFLTFLLSTRLSVAAEQKRCSTCTSKERLRADVYGIDLSIEYINAKKCNFYMSFTYSQLPIISAVAAKYVNGTRAPIARIPTSDEYRNLLRQWLSDSDLNSSPSSYAHDHVPINHSDPLPQLTESDQPPSPSIGIVAKEITGVIQTLTRVYGLDIYRQHIGISVPVFITSQQAKDIREGAGQAILGVKVAFGSSDILGNLAADTRTHRSYLEWQLNERQRQRKRHDDDKQNRPRTTLVLEYNAPMLAGSVIYRANGSEERISYFADPSLGAEKSWKLDANGIGHWERVSSRITGLVHDAIEASHNMKTIPQPPASTSIFDLTHLKVVLQGEKAADARLRRTIGEALLNFVVTWRDMKRWEDLVSSNGDLGPLSSPDEEYEVVFNSALGAAHSGKWYLDAPRPEGCIEDIECIEARKIVVLDATTDARVRTEEL
ncbi:hypothetical protein B7463_g2998, partial [Scytalidium lignicola]